MLTFQSAINLMTKLILGTAEFNPAGYAGKPCPSNQEIVRILNRAWEGGVRTLDCADTYGTENIEDFFGGFDRINKTRTCTLPCYWYHYKPDEPLQAVQKASVYEIEQLAGLDEAIVPMSINNTDFINSCTSCIPYVRSVFDRGRLLDQGYSVRDCLSFVARQKIKGVIVGVNSVKELEEILTAWGSIHGK